MLDNLVVSLLEEEVSKHPHTKLQYEWIQPQKDLPFSAEHKSLLRIGAEMQKLGKTCTIKLPKHIEGMIANHIKEYEWFLTFHFLGEPMTREYVTSTVMELIKTKDCRKRLAEMQSEFEDRNKRIQKVKTTSPRLRNLINICEEYGHMRTYRIDIATEGTFYLRSLLGEIAKRIGLDYNDFIYLTVEEIIKALSGKLKINSLHEKIAKRKDYFIIYTVNDGEVFLFEGNEYKPAELLAPQNQTIVGKVAQRGRVTGKVKVIWNFGEIDKVNKGDIIVSPMTTPEMVVGILKCGGIITDEGGIASHAAQISREFKIPCIMGTGNATSVLKDNDIVEIIADGAEGIVNIVKC